MTALKKKRLALDLRQEQIAKQIGVKKSTYSGWETGSRTPEPGVYSKLARALKTTPEDVVNLVNETVKQNKLEAVTK